MTRDVLSKCLLLLLAVTIPGIAGVLQEPKVSVPKYIELGRGEVAACEVPNPADSETLLIQIYFGLTKMDTNQRRTADSEIAQTIISPDEPGKFWVKCLVSDDKETKEANANVTVYNFPNPVLEIKEDDEDEHILLITCKLPDVNPKTVSIHVTVKRTVLECSDSDTPTERTCSLPSVKNHNGKEVICEAGMWGLEKNMTKTTKTNLDIQYPPEFDDSKCPRNQTLVEGMTDLVFCTADGNPEPSVVCEKDGLEFTGGLLPRVTRGHSGLYKCRALNKLDNDVRDVSVSVQPKNLAYFIRASSAITVSMLVLTILVLHSQ